MWKKVVLAVACVSLALVGLARAEEASKKAAMVVSSADLSAGFDKAMHDRLVSLGFEVTVVVQGDVGGAFTRDMADTYDLLLVSESISSSRADPLRGTTAAVIHNEAYGWDNWLFTRPINIHWASGSTVEIVNTSHPIAQMASVKMGQMAFFSSPAAWTVDSVVALAPGAELIAKINDGGTDCAVIFAIEKDAPLADGSPAPSRIVGLSIPANASYTADAMTNQAWALFDAAVRWATYAANPVLARDPSPADTATDVARDVILSWRPGVFADKHDVYLGPVFEDVNEGKALVSAGQDANWYAPGLLDFGRTYYWRVDEVNALPDRTVFRGQVWSFTTEPYSYPIRNVTATASSSFSADSGPGKTVDGSGLDKLDRHDISATNMWLSAKDQAGSVWIQFEFDMAYKLDRMWVWNSNHGVESIAGLGVKAAKVEYSVDGATWTALADVPEFGQAPGTADYEHNTTVDFGGAVAKYVRLTCLESWGGRKQYGLSEVRFFYIPVHARYPEPAVGATGVLPDVVLRWRAGRQAAFHEVYLGTASDGLVLLGKVSGNSYDPGDLMLGTQYYWRIDEVNSVAEPSRWEGVVWGFRTAEGLVVDDFERYTNRSPNRVFQVWIDGLGFSADEYYPVGGKGNGTGAIVGYDPGLGNIMETGIVHGGRQSMPLSYDGLSEATRTFEDFQDWTRYGIRFLVLYFYGKVENVVGELYVKINGVKVSYGGDPGDLAAGQWKQWRIDLSSVGGLNAVKSLTIGVSSGKGTLYIDDIALYRN